MNLMHDLPHASLEHIATFFLPETMHRFVSTCKTAHTALQPSTTAWHAIGRQICGAAYWDSGVRRWVGYPHIVAETPMEFARRMLCPWLQTPRELGLWAGVEPPQPNREVRALTVQMCDGAEWAEDSSRRRIAVLCATAAEGRSLEVERSDTEVDEHQVHARPFDDRSLLDKDPQLYNGGSDEENISAYEMQIALARDLVTVAKDVAGVALPPRCWRYGHVCLDFPCASPSLVDEMPSSVDYINVVPALHAGTVVAFFKVRGRGCGFCFVSVRKRAIIRSLYLPGDDGFYPDEQSIVLRPGEMWVLDAFYRSGDIFSPPAHLGGRLLYFGPVGV